MKLVLHDRNDELLCSMDNDDEVLAVYGVEDGMRVHVCTFSASTEHAGR
jgi:hypothetical protein